MLEPMSKAEENRIIRNLALACTENISNLDKNGYDWIMTKSGFIAHYNRGGFITHYGNGSMLAQEIMGNVTNTYCNRHEGESDYAYYKQSADMYARLCKIIQGKRKIPAESTCFIPPNIRDSFPVEETWEKSLDVKWAKTFSFGNFFGVNSDSADRIKDLTMACMAYNHLVIQCIDENKLDDHKCLQKEFTFPSGNTGTISSLVECYGPNGWDRFNLLSDRNMEIGVFEEEETE